MKKRVEFKATILRSMNRELAYIECPAFVDKDFKAKQKVGLTFDGYVGKGTLEARGNVCLLVHIPKDIFDVLGKQPGEEVYVTMRERED